jgi:hypothetical protein
MPTRLLPDNPSLEHLKYQAKDLQRTHAEGNPVSLQRIREFHPRFSKLDDAAIRAAPFSLTDARLAISREYGFASWARLKKQVEDLGNTNLNLPYIERIEDPVFRRAVELLDEGDLSGLHAHLIAHPQVTHDRVVFEGGNYFTNPSLLDFIAENPIRKDWLPSNIIELTKLILDAGGKDDVGNVGHTLCLVCSGRVAREQHVQVPLINLLCDYGANPIGALPPAITHSEFEAVDALLNRGAELTLSTAASLNRVEDVKRLIPASSPEERHFALACAAQHGRTESLKLLIDAGEDPSRYNPPGAHSHSTPLHQAVVHGHLETVKFLVERGARLDLEDVLFHSTPLGWAEYGGQSEIAVFLRDALNRSQEG